MRNTYDKLEAIKYTSDNGNGHPYWLFNDLKREFGINGEITDQVPGHCMKMHIDGVVDYALSLSGVYGIAYELDMDKLKAYMLGYGDYDRIEMIYEYLLRIKLRETIKIKDKQLSGRLPTNKSAIIKSNGDEALFGIPTREIKQRYGIPHKKSIYDYMSSQLLFLKITAMQKTIDYNGYDLISDVYIRANKDSRLEMIQYGMDPLSYMDTNSIDAISGYIDSCEDALDDKFVVLYPFVII